MKQSEWQRHCAALEALYLMKNIRQQVDIIPVFSVTTFSEGRYQVQACIVSCQ